MFLEAKSGDNNGNGSNDRVEPLVSKKPDIGWYLEWYKESIVPLTISFNEKHKFGRKQVKSITLCHSPKGADRVTLYQAFPEEANKPTYFLAVEGIDGKPITIIELEAITAFDSNGRSIRFSTGFDHDGNNQHLLGAKPDGAIFDHPSDLDLWGTTLKFFEDGNAALYQSRGKDMPLDLPGMRTPKSELANIGVQEKLTERERKIAEYTKRLDKVERQISELRRSGNNMGKVGKDRMSSLVGEKRSIKVKLYNTTSGKKY